MIVLMCNILRPRQYYTVPAGLAAPGWVAAGAGRGRWRPRRARRAPRPVIMLEREKGRERGSEREREGEREGGRETERERESERAREKGRERERESTRARGVCVCVCVCVCVRACESECVCVAGSAGQGGSLVERAVGRRDSSERECNMERPPLHFGERRGGVARGE